MKKMLPWLLAVMFALGTVQGSQKEFSYISPQPGAGFVSKETNIILRASARVSPASLTRDGLIAVEGSSSGLHTGRLHLSDDGRTVLFDPAIPFERGETVNVRVHAGLKDIHGNALPPLAFSFTISNNDRRLPIRKEFETEGLNASVAGEPWSIMHADTLPTITVLTSDNPSPGYLFLSNIVFSAIPNTNCLLIVDNNGDIVFSRQMPARCHDFKLQPNGFLTYYDSYRGHFKAMNSQFVVVDSFMCGNGYETDEHELRLLPNGHALLMSYDPEQVRMDTIVSGGSPNAIVVGLVVQELDAERNVVFQWRSWDHFRITDVRNLDLTSEYIDYVHGNALEMDTDNNIILSSRHLDEITKIDHETGEMIWRWGGSQNQFTFVNDPGWFSHQHAVRRLPNGHITMFDNGNFHSPRVSRAVEYTLDEVNKVATRVWSYANPEGTYGAAMGYVQRLANGNTLIGWGSTNPTVTEVRPDGARAFEMTFAPGVYSYRAYRFDFQLTSVENTPALPARYSLAQNYPNPFNPSTTISFELPATSRVTLTVFDMLGREVARLVDGEFPAGKQSVRWNGENATGTKVASGVYFYRLHAVSGSGEFSSIKRMILLK